MTGSQDSNSLREYLDFLFGQIDAKLAKLEEDVDSLEATRSELSGKADASVVTRVIVLSVASLLVAAASLLLHVLQMP